MALNKAIRLQKYLALCGIASRRKAEELIASGKVCVDGVTVKQMGVKVTPGKNRITCFGKPVIEKESLLYFLLNKPRGYVTTVSDPQGRPVVTALIKNVRARLFPVGRLDFDTEGALILTNDGQLAQKIQHPSHQTNKTYQALIRGIPGKKKLSALENGILLDNKMTAPAKIRILARRGKNCLAQITIHEGRKHQVKKMFRYINHPVLNLKRTHYGRLGLGSLNSGHYRQLNSNDLKKIFL